MNNIYINENKMYFYKIQQTISKTESIADEHFHMIDASNSESAMMKAFFNLVDSYINKYSKKDTIYNRIKEVCTVVKDQDYYFNHKNTKVQNFRYDIKDNKYHGAIVTLCFYSFITPEEMKDIKEAQLDFMKNNCSPFFDVYDIDISYTQCLVMYHKNTGEQHYIPNVDMFRYDLNSETDVEFITRMCYQSQNKMKMPLNTENQFVQNILNHRHTSVLEHITFTTMLTNISRGASHQIVRHRHNAYTQTSTRYVKMSNAVCIPNNPEFFLENEEYQKMILESFDKSLQEYNTLLEKYKKAELARDVLTHNCNTNLTVTFNLASINDFLTKRMDKHAQSEIRNIATILYLITSSIYPNIISKDYENMGILKV